MGEHRWKQKVTKLKARAETSDVRHTPPQGAHPGYYSKSMEGSWSQGHPAAHSQKVPGDYYGQAPQDYYPQSGHLPQPGSAEAPKRASSNGAPRFHASRREPGLGDAEGQEGLLNQGGLLSISSISPQTSVPPLPGDGAGESARSTDSGMLPQRPTRRHVVKPDNVPRLDFSRLKDQMEEEEEEEMEAEGSPGEKHAGVPMDYHYGQDDDLGSDYGEMQAHGKISRHEDMGLGDLSEEMMHHRVHGEFMRPDNPVGDDDDDYDDYDEDDADNAIAKYLAAGGRAQNIRPGLSDRSQ